MRLDPRARDREVQTGLTRRSQRAAHARCSDAEYFADALPAAVLQPHAPGGGYPLRRHHTRPPSNAALAAGVIEAPLRVIANGVDAELREHGDNAVERPPHRCCRVNHRLCEADDVHLASVKILQRFNQDAFAAGEAVEPTHFEGVARSEVVETGEPLRSFGDAAGFAEVDEHSFATSSTQLGLLRLWVLISLRDAGVSDFVCHAENGTA